MRKSFSGAAAPTYLTSPPGPTDLTLNVADTTNWPDTTVGPFVTAIDRGTTTEEKVLISSYTSTVLTVASGGRGYDGTTAVAHSVGVSPQVVCTLDAVTINEANLFVNSNGTVPPTASAIGDASADGTSTVSAAADHRHARENFGVNIVSASNPGDTESDGASVDPARGDHKHARETWGPSATASQPGDTEAAGTATTPSRSDHLHGREVSSATSTTHPATPYVGQTVLETDTGYLVTWNGTAWQMGLVRPTGRMHQSGGTTSLGTVTTPITNMVSDWLDGGFTFAANGLTVPVPGPYIVTWSLDLTGASAGNNLVGYAYLCLNGTTTVIHRAGSGVPNGTYAVWSGATTVNLAAKDTLYLAGVVGNFAMVTQATMDTSVSATLVSC